MGFSSLGTSVPPGHLEGTRNLNDLGLGNVI